MKNLYALVLSGAMCFSACAQISTYPYVESFDASSQCSGWTVTTGTWYHNTTNGTIEVDNHNQTNVHAFLYSPFLNTNSLNHPVVSFDLRITADDSTGCVPELDLGYYDSINPTVFNAIQMNMACNRNCTGGLSAYWYVPDANWRHMQFDLVQYPHMQLEFNSVFQGTGMFEVKNVYIGERTATTGITTIESDASSFYPNPSSSKIYLSTTKNQGAKISLLNLMGQEVFSSGATISDYIDVSNVPSGMYIIQAEDQKKIIQQKISISH